MTKYSLTRQADRQLRKLSFSIQQRIIKKIDTYFSSEDPLVLAERLTHIPEKVYRFRIGDYRVVFDQLDGKFLITIVGHRRNVYRKLRG